MADGSTFPPYSTIPGLAPATGLNFTDQVWINQAGLDRRANLGDIAALMPITVTAWNGRTGPVQMTLLDITNAGGAPNTSPVLTGVPQAPTPPRGAADNRIATAAFVADAIQSEVAGVSSFNGRQGAVTLTGADITGAGGVTGGPYLALAGGTVTGNLTVGGLATLGDIAISASKPADTILAAPAGAAGAPSFRTLTPNDIPLLGYLQLTGGTVTGNVTVNGLTANAQILAQGALGGVAFAPRTGAGTFQLYNPSGTDLRVYGAADIAVFSPTLATLPDLALTASKAANTVFAAPAGAAGAPSFRALAGADLPNPAAASKGGVQSFAAVAHQFLNSISTAGVPGAAQPATGDLSDVAALTSWTPTLTFATPGDLAVTYSGRTGRIFKIGPLVCFAVQLVINTLTYTTASGALEVTGLPYSATVNVACMPTIMTGFNWPSGTTMLQVFINSSNIIVFYGIGNGVQTQLTTANFPAGGGNNIQFFGVFF